MKYSTVVERVIFCPQCKGEDIKINAMHTEKVLVSMDEYSKPEVYQCGDSLLRYYQYRAVCTMCGYSVEFQRSGS